MVNSENNDPEITSTLLIYQVKKNYTIMQQMRKMSYAFTCLQRLGRQTVESTHADHQTLTWHQLQFMLSKVKSIFY